MKKALSLFLAAILVFSLTACQAKPAAPSPAPADPSSATPAESAAGRATVQSVFGKQIKIAVVRNLGAGDHTQQYLEGCVSEGNSFGFIVDTFVTDGDNAKCQERIAQVIEKDYDGIIVSHAELGYAYDALKPAVDKGMKVVTFDSMPYKDREVKDENLLEGCTSTAQDDYKLAELSLGELVKSANQPVRVLKLWMGPGIPPLDRRQEIYKKLEDEGKIKTLEVIGPSDFSSVRDSTTNLFSAVLPKYPVGTVDAIWGSYDELAKGALTALNDANRTDIKMFTIDISNDDINLMRSNPDVWLSTASVDPKLIGQVNMRLMAKKLKGEETPMYYNLNAALVKTADLKSDTNMLNLHEIIPGWGDGAGVFETDWMAELRKTYQK